MLKSSPWWYRHKRAGKLINSATPQAQNQGFGLAHPNIHPIYGLLKCMKGWVLQDLHDTAQQQAIREESSEVLVLIVTTEARGLKPDQGAIAMNICK